MVNLEEPVLVNLLVVDRDNVGKLLAVICLSDDDDDDIDDDDEHPPEEWVL